MATVLVMFVSTDDALWVGAETYELWTGPVYLDERLDPQWDTSSCLQRWLRIDYILVLGEMFTRVRTGNPGIKLPKAVSLSERRAVP